MRPDRSSEVEPRARPIQRWLLYAGLLLLAIGLAPGASRVYSGAIHIEGNALFGCFGAGRSISFEWVDPGSRTDRSDTRMQGWLEAERTRRWRAVFSLARRGYWPSAAFAALLLATPMSGRRRILALAGGLVSLNLFLLSQLALLGACAFAASSASSPFWRALLPLARGSFNSPVASYVLVFVLWVLFARPSAAIDFTAAIRLGPGRRTAR